MTITVDTVAVIIIRIIIWVVAFAATYGGVSFLASLGSATSLILGIWMARTGNYYVRLKKQFGINEFKALGDPNYRKIW